MNNLAEYPGEKPHVTIQTTNIGSCFFVAGYLSIRTKPAGQAGWQLSAFHPFCRSGCGIYFNSTGFTNNFFKPK